MFESSCCRFEASAISFTPHCSYSIIFVDEYMAIDSLCICGRVVFALFLERGRMTPREVVLVLEGTAMPRDEVLTRF